MAQTHLKPALRVAALALLTISLARLSSAQITDRIQVTMSHPFIVVNTTLPPGKYYFRIVSYSAQSIMTVTSTDGNTAAEFEVRQSEADHVPQHTELVFNRYGKEEYLHRIYQKGNQLGVTVDEPSIKEARLQQTGEHPVEHTESQ